MITKVKNYNYTMKKLFWIVVWVWFLVGGGGKRVLAVSCQQEKTKSCGVGICNSSCQAVCPSGYIPCDKSCGYFGKTYYSCGGGDVKCDLKNDSGGVIGTSKVCCCPAVSPACPRSAANIRFEDFNGGMGGYKLEWDETSAIGYTPEQYRVRFRGATAENPGSVYGEKCSRPFYKYPDQTDVEVHDYQSVGFDDQSYALIGTSYKKFNLSLEICSLKTGCGDQCVGFSGWRENANCKIADFDNDNDVDLVDANFSASCSGCKKGDGCWASCWRANVDNSGTSEGRVDDVDRGISEAYCQSLWFCLDRAVPTPTPPAICDSTCGAGVCGVRLANGLCVADWGNAIYKLNCCHMGCVNSSCQYVVGGGSWNCGSCQPSPSPVQTKLINPYCSSAGLYPYGPYQDRGGSGNTDNLPGIYSKYVPFTVSFTSKTNGVVVRAGNWGGMWRTVFCKITDGVGATDITPESDADEFVVSSGAQWRKILFPTSVTLTSGQNYRLYCRGSDSSNMVYWVYDPTKNANNDLAKLYGRTYGVCMQ